MGLLPACGTPSKMGAILTFGCVFACLLGSALVVGRLLPAIWVVCVKELLRALVT